MNGAFELLFRNPSARDVRVRRVRLKWIAGLTSRFAELIDRGARPGNPGAADSTH